jgi:hypothetical protein
MVVEHQNPSLVQIMVFSKTRPAALEEYITMAVVINFYLIWWSISGHFSQYSLAELPSIHKIRKLQRDTLMLMALGANKSKKGEQTPRK